MTAVRDNDRCRATPGPWTTGDDGFNGHRDSVFSKPTIAIIARCDFFSDEQTNFANARLISAAPEMFEALKALVDAASTRLADKPEALHLARAALSKAQGA